MFELTWKHCSPRDPLVSPLLQNTKGYECWVSIRHLRWRLPSVLAWRSSWELWPIQLWGEDDMMGTYDKITDRTVLTFVKERPNPDYKNGRCRVRYKKVWYKQKPHWEDAAGMRPTGQMVRCTRFSMVKSGIQRPGKSLPRICTSLLVKFRR